MRIKWGMVLAVILAIFVISRWRQIREAIAELGLGDFWRDFGQTLGDIPPLGKYAVVLMVFALLFLTVYFLVLKRIRRDQ
jgi:hypothetical protein